MKKYLREKSFNWSQYLNPTHFSYFGKSMGKRRALVTHSIQLFYIQSRLSFIKKNIYENKQIYPIRMAIGNAVLYCLYFLSRVFGSVEAREQEQEHHTMQSNPEHKVFWIIAFTEGQLELMTEYGNKLYHLECCQMLFPPNVLLVFWAHRRNHIIEIHNNVNEWVEHSKECAMAACKSEIETTTTFIRW